MAAFTVKRQPIPALRDNYNYHDAWAWAVSEGQFIVARFMSEEAALDYAAWKNAAVEVHAR